MASLPTCPVWVWAKEVGVTKKEEEMRIWLDDERPMPQGFDEHCHTAEEVMDILTYSRSLITHIDFDHDLGKGATGYDLAHLIERMAEKRLVNPISWHVHSSNPVGSKRIEHAMKSAERFWYKDASAR